MHLVVGDGLVGAEHLGRGLDWVVGVDGGGGEVLGHLLDPLILHLKITLSSSCLARPDCGPSALILVNLLVVFLLIFTYLLTIISYHLIILTFGSISRNAGSSTHNRFPSEC